MYIGMYACVYVYSHACMHIHLCIQSMHTCMCSYEATYRQHLKHISISAN